MGFKSSRDAPTTQNTPGFFLEEIKTAPLLYPTTYSHTSTVFSAILDSILSSSSSSLHHHRHLPPILTQMIHSSSSTRDPAFSAAILSLSRAGLPDLSLSLFRSIPLSNCPRWPHSLHSALHVLLSRNDLQAASQLLDEMSHRAPHVPITLRSLNLLIDSLCRLRRVDLATQLFAEIREQCCYPDRDSYRGRGNLPKNRLRVPDPPVPAQRLEEGAVDDDVILAPLLRYPPQHGVEEVDGVVEVAGVAESAHEHAVDVIQKKVPKWSTRWMCLQTLSLACLVISVASAVGSIAGVVDDLKIYKPFING